MAKPPRHVRWVPNCDIEHTGRAKGQTPASLRWGRFSCAPKRRRDRSLSPVPYLRSMLCGVTPSLTFPPITLFLNVRTRPPVDVARPVAFQATVE